MTKECINNNYQQKIIRDRIFTFKCIFCINPFTNSFFIQNMWNCSYLLIKGPSERVNPWSQGINLATSPCHPFVCTSKPRTSELTLSDHLCIDQPTSLFSPDLIVGTLISVWYSLILAKCPTLQGFDYVRSAITFMDFDIVLRNIIHGILTR